MVTTDSDNKLIRLTDCPRDAMQGMSTFIPTRRKVDYLNQLMQVGFDILDFGSFVSPSAIPQLRDTAEVVDQIDLENSHTSLLAIVGNMRGALKASGYGKITWLGFPFSVSETFLRLNLNSTLPKAFGQLCEMQNLCIKRDKKLMVYLSMGFGNPYGDSWSRHQLAEWVEKMQREGITEINLSDTVGLSTPETVADVFGLLVPEFPAIKFGFHLHAKPSDWHSRVDAAWQNGCRSFDGVLLGGGGCPMTGVDLVGNLPMQNLVAYCAGNQIGTNLRPQQYSAALKAAALLYHDIEHQFK